MAAAAPLQSLKEEATCSICLGYFTEPVSVECGHAFCLSCITQCWEGLEANFPCPQCRETSQSKTLRPNWLVANMVAIAKQLHASSNTPQEENLCREHEEKLKLFCEDDQRPICVVCSMSRDQKPHTVLPISEAAQEYKDKLYSQMEHLKKELKDLQEWVEEEGRKASELEDVKSVLRRCSEVKALKPQEDAPGMETTLQSTTRHAHLQEKLTELKETFPAEMDWRYMKSCEREVTLDPGTAHPELIVSADGRSVRWGPRAQDLPDTPQRFTIFPCVLGREGLSSGGHYWEVEVWGCQGWALGVCDESVPRKWGLTASPARGVWAVGLQAGKYKALTSPPTLLTPRAPPRVLGFFLDYEAGRLSVYDAQDRALLFTFPGAPFPRSLRPFFWTWSPEGGLRILPGAGGD
ncbi:E3 ubiquitin-protein ligase TRIM39-like isoform X2 [Ambystoma mexicanum]|uniref:E3 ubiquitin-protein ligase TRIM39-like isoform X2 n=1 Tax=Ambystoma mexicanum TaxID=8296 RepID=UPI0037E7E017